MKKTEFNFWQGHSRHYLEMALRMDRRKILQNPDGYGKRTGQCGDTVEMFLSVSNGRIQTVSFLADGCLNTNACANTVAQLAESKTLEEAWGITPEDVVDYLKNLPPKNEHCAELAVGAFYLALTRAQEIRRSPWKKSYQKARP